MIIEHKIVSLLIWFHDSLLFLFSSRKSLFTFSLCVGIITNIKFDRPIRSIKFIGSKVGILIYSLCNWRAEHLKDNYLPHIRLPTLSIIVLKWLKYIKAYKATWYNFEPSTIWFLSQNTSIDWWTTIILPYIKTTIQR